MSGARSERSEPHSERTADTLSDDHPPAEPAAAVRAWQAATAALTEALAGLAMGGVLTLSLRDGSGPRVAVGALPNGTLRAEATGWPAWDVREAARGEQEDLAREVILVLRDGASTPGDVTVAAEHTAVPAGLAVPAGQTALTGDPDAMDLTRRTRIGVAEAIGADPDGLTVDEDGDIPVRSGSAVVFVRVVEDPELVRVFAPVVADVPYSPGLLERLNDLNGRHLLARAAYRSGAVVIDVPLIGSGLTPEQVGIALTVIAELADEVDDLIVAEFGGRRFLDDGAKPSTVEPGLGGYI